MVLCIITIIFLHVQNYAMEFLYFYLSYPAAENQGSERGNVSNEWLHSSQVVGAEFRLVLGGSNPALTTLLYRLPNNTQVCVS